MTARVVHHRGARRRVHHSRGSSNVAARFDVRVDPLLVLEMTGNR
jgi:hypothetical protein